MSANLCEIPAYFDDRQLAHDPTRELHNGGWADYAEKPSRAESIAKQFATLEPVVDHGLNSLLRVHSPEYIDFLRSAHEAWQAAGRAGDAIGYTWPIARRRELHLDRIDARLGQYSYDAATPITGATWEAAYWSAQSALGALEAVLQERYTTAFALCRPPGHHAGRDYMGGYCYLNSAAAAAAEARHRRRRVAVLDVDYHHGNGTQDIFLDSGEVLFVSIHANPTLDYPFFWGHADEVGIAGGLGKTVNLPLPRGTHLEAYLVALQTACAAVVEHGTDLLVVSFGADTFEKDPISHFMLREADYAKIGSRIAALGVATVIVMEGGYAIDALGRIVMSFLSGFASAERSVVLP
jgi:acetoin utilization deacetylase AcuC-like enzyme